MTYSLIVDLFVAILLVVTIGYAIVLNRRLGKLRGDKAELEKLATDVPELMIAGPAPAPLLRAENFYRYQIMLRLGQMSALSRPLALIDAQLTLHNDVTLTIDIDPVNLS